MAKKSSARKSKALIWPNGKKEEIPGVTGDESITIAEGKGVVKALPLVTKR